MKQLQLALLIEVAADRQPAADAAPVQAQVHLRQVGSGKARIDGHAARYQHLGLERDQLAHRFVGAVVRAVASGERLRMAADGDDRALRMRAAVRAGVDQHGVGQGAGVGRCGRRERRQAAGLPQPATPGVGQAGDGALFAQHVEQGGQEVAAAGIGPADGAVGGACQYRVAGRDAHAA